MAAEFVKLQAQLHKLTSQLDEVSREREALTKGEPRHSDACPR